MDYKLLERVLYLMYVGFVLVIYVLLTLLTQYTLRTQQILGEGMSKGQC